MQPTNDNIEPGLRVGDAEREATTDHVISAHGLGQLNADEMTERLEAVHAAKFRPELDAVTADLPSPPPATAQLSSMERARNAFGNIGALSNARTIALITAAVLSGAGMALLFVGGDQEHEGYDPGPGMHPGGHGDGREFEGAPSAWLLLIPVIAVIIAALGWFVYHRRQQRS